MAVFVIFRVSHGEAVAAALQKSYPDDHYHLGNNEWLVSSTKTAKELSVELGISADPSISNAIIFKMASYFGRTQPDVWDWIKTKVEAQGG